MPHVTRRSGLLLSCVIALLASGCSGSGEPATTVSVPEVQFGPASNTDGLLRPTPNGFSFVNFAADSVPAEEFGGADLAAMFGSGPEICSSGSDNTCSPTAEAREWARMINESRQSGHCEGFIVQALQRFGTKESPDTSSLTNSPNVVHGIMRGFASQFLPGTRAESKAWSKRSVRDITAELVSSLKDGTPDYVLGVYGDIGGHAVLPYSVTFSDADHASIGIYDSNWPGQERHITVDLAAQEWVFSFDGTGPETDPGAWTGGNGSMDLSSLNAHVQGPCPFCDSKTTTTTPTMLAIRASAPTWSLSTARGTVSPSGASVEGVHVSKVRAGAAIPAKTNEWVVTVEPTEISAGKSVRLSLPAGSSAVIVTPKAIARAATDKKATADFSINDRSITTASKTADLTLTNGDRKVSAANKAVTLTLDGDDAPVVGSTTPTTVAQTTTTIAKTTTTRPTSSATTTTTIANQTAGTTVTTAAPATTSAPTTVAQTTTTTNPVNFTQSFRNGGANGYWNSCSSEILDLTVTGAATVTSVTGSVGGTTMSSAMNSSGNDWTFYSMPTQTPGTYTMTITVNASNGVLTKTLSIVYDNDCIQGN